MTLANSHTHLGQLTAGANGQRERGDWVYRVGVGVGFIGAGVEMAGEETGRQDETHSRSVRETPERRSWPGGRAARRYPDGARR